MELHKKVKILTMTCSECPEQYEGELESGEKIYIRFRWGSGRIDIQGITAAYIEGELGDGLRGYFEENELKKLINSVGIEVTDDQIEQARYGNS